MQGLNRRLYTLLTLTMFRVYIPKDFYYSRGFKIHKKMRIKGKKVLLPKCKSSIPKKSGMSQIEWPDEEYLDTLKPETRSGLHCVTIYHKNTHWFNFRLNNDHFYQPSDGTKKEQDNWVQ